MRPLIILHGWQSSKEKWQEIKNNIESSELRVIVPDIPGFKPETELKEAWNLDNYVEWFNNFLLKEKAAYPELAEGFFLLGHSFGGRVAIKFASQYPEKLKGLILVSSAGIKKKRNKFSQLTFFTPVKKVNWIMLRLPALRRIQPFFRKFFYRFILRKTDYLQASGALKETIKNVLDEDLTPLLEKISVPTLILWGKKDKMTPVKDAYLMHREIPNSQLKVFEGIGHSLRRENPKLLVEEIIKFLR